MTGADGFGYKGVFEGGKRQGAGTLYVINGSYSIDGMFVDNQPEIFPNEVHFELVSPLEPKKEVVDPKAKNPKATEVKESNFTEEEESTYGSRKIFFEYKPEAEEQPEIAFNIKILY